jgi:hypothetical protein
MLSRLFGKRPSIEDLQKLLAQARRHLWNNELSDAEKLFNQVLKELDEIDPKTPSSEVDTARLQTRLGIWAISYFRRAEQRSKVQQIHAGHSLNAETAFFVAKVFQIRKDRSAEALSAYAALLRLKPAPNLAQRIGDILANSPVSEDAVKLLELVTSILKDNVSFRSQLCRWYLKLDRKQHAHDMAREILLVDEQNIDGHRCLAYLAEVNQDWDTAIQHYSASRDWLRVAVAASKADRISEAAQALAQVGEEEQHNPTWLFYKGWVAFRQNNFTEARQTWQQLQIKHPSPAASAVNEAVAEHATYHELQLFASDQDKIIQPVIAPFYEDVWTLRRGAIKLLLNRDVKGSKPLLQKAVSARRKSLVAATYYGLCASLEGVAGGDASIYQYLVKHFGDASLFLWLRGLLMLQGKQANAIRYLLKAHQEGVFERHLPLDAGRAVSWLVSRLTSESLAPVPTIEANHLLLALDGKAPFIGAVLPSFVLSAVKNGADSSFLRDQGNGRLMSPAWSEVKSIVLASCREWQLALQSLDGGNQALKMRIIQHAFTNAVRDRDWSAAAEYIGQGLAVRPDDPVLKRSSERLRPFMWQRLWALRELNALDHELEKRINADKATTAAYHQLAIVYTQIALQRDRAAANGATFSIAEHRTQSPYIGVLEDQAHNDYWQLAVGYWAVALSDRDYWRDWAQKRSEIYGEAVSSSQVQELIEVRVPHLLQSYHQEQSGVGSKYAAHHRYYGALVKREIELTAALRYWLRVADTQRIELPNEMRRYVSPLLIKEYGYEQLARQTVAQSSQLRLSPYEAGLIREAFSPVSDVKALVEVKDYPAALERLRWLLGEAVYKEYHAELWRELVTVTRMAAAHFLDDEKWEDAYNVALQGLEIQDHDKELEQIAVKASIGWAGERVREDSHAAAIRRLEQVKASLQGAFPELNQFLSEVYVEWALQALNEDDLNLTVTRLEKAIAAHSTNGRAREIMSAIYNDWAVEKAQVERFRDALKDAETALRYSENARSLALIAMLNRSLAVQAAERNDARTADSYWVKARETAFKYIESANTQASLDLFVDISSGYVIFLYTRQDFAAALQIGERLLELDYDRDAVNVKLEELLSAICTDYGAALYNGGNRREGRKLTQKAVQYNPSNLVARQNLSRM